MLGTRAPEFLPYLVGPAVVILAIIYRAPKGLSLLFAVIVGICTKDENRQDACVEMVRALCQAPSWRSQSPARPTLPTTRPRTNGTGNSPPSLPSPKPRGKP